MTESNDTANTPTPERSAAAFLAEARPGDALEAMLIEQTAAVHDAAMRCLSRAAEVAAEHPEIEARYLREAARLLNLFQRQTDALDRRRIKAEDRAATNARDARFAEKDWQEDCGRARLNGKRPPKRPERPGPAWPAWPARAEAGEDGAGTAEGRAAKGRAAERRRLN
jgi:hypothetical protein